jgi:hypothetical protein
MECEFCKKTLSNKMSLTRHQKTSKYCLDIRGVSQSNQFVCDHCSKVLTTSQRLTTHYLSCSKNALSMVNEQLKRKDEIILFLREEINDLKDRLGNTSIKKIEDPPSLEVVLSPLEVGEGMTIDYRLDGYIDVTSLCKAAGKDFDKWNSLSGTKNFLKVLSSTVGIPTIELIQRQTGSVDARHTWVHPQIAINIAQLVSPQFNVKVSAWIYDVVLSQTKSYRDLQRENKGKEITIQKLTRRYVKKCPRIEYPENVVYILTTTSLEKDRRYILGKASNLTNRLSTYNKSDEHKVVFYQECKNKEIMNLLEPLVFQKLYMFREQANRERFVLPENESVELFSREIENCMEFLR